MRFGSNTIVLVEDDVLIRLLVADLLVEAGFAVITASDADEALAALRKQADRVGLLFTDISMPGPMTGLDLAYYVHEHWPGIPLLIASGQHAPTATELPAGSRFLRKPYLVAQAIAHAREMISA